MYDNYAGAVPAAPDTVIESAFRDLAGNIEGLHDSIESLERRFGRALIPPLPPQETSLGGLKAVEQIESPMLCEINTLKRRVIFANNRLADILSRAQI